MDLLSTAFAAWMIGLVFEPKASFLGLWGVLLSITKESESATKHKE